MFEIDIGLKLLDTSNYNLPDDLQLAAKIIAEIITGNDVIIESTMSTQSGKSWTLEVKSEFPVGCATIAIEITGTSHRQKKTFRFGSVHLLASDIVAKADNRQRFVLHQDVKTVDNSLSFHLRAGFLISSIQSDLQSTDDESYAEIDHMIKMLSLRNPQSLDLNVLDKVCWSIRLLSIANPNRSVFLSNMGEIYMARSDALDKAVDVYEDALLNAPREDHRRPIYAGRCGLALQERFERKGTVSDINKSISVLEDAVRRIPQSHPDKPAILNNLGLSLVRRFECLGNINDINKSISVNEDAVNLTPNSDPRKLSRLSNLASSLLLRFKHLGDVSDIHKSVSLNKGVVQLTPDGHPDKPTMLNNLTGSLLDRFNLLGDLSDIKMSISVNEDAARRTPDGHPGKPSYLNNLGNSLLHRFERLSDIGDINKSVSMLEEAVRLTPDGHTGKPLRLTNLGKSLLDRFKCLGDVSDINKSVSVTREAVRLTPDGRAGKPTMLNILGSSLACRFGRLGNLVDINNSISVFSEALRLVHDGHPEKPSILNNFGTSLSTQRSDRDTTDINNSVLYNEEAVRLTQDGHPRKPLYLQSLGTSLFHRFERFGDVSDINKSVLVFEDAIRLTPNGHPDKPARLNHLGSSLTERFSRLGDLCDIHRSISVKEESVRLTPDSHPDKPLHLNNLGTSFCRRFDRLGDIGDINKSISALEEAVRLIPDGHHEKPSVLSCFGSSLLQRFQRLGDLSDINKSIWANEEAVRLTPDGHPDKFLWLSNLGGPLMRRFERLKDIHDINKSVSVNEEAVRLTPDNHPGHLLTLNNFGSSLSIRFKHLGNVNDINKSVSVLEEAIRLTPDGHPFMPTWLSNLGESLSCRFDLLLDLNDINKAISLLEEAVRLMPDAYERSLWLNNLGESLWRRFEHLGDLSDIKMAGKIFEQAAKSPTGSPIRFRACFSWARYCQLYDRSSVLDAYHRAINLLPTLAWLGLSITDRQYFLQKVGPIVDEAVSAAIDAGEFETAVEWMDQGHSVVWGQLLQLRNPVDDLKHRHPDLADKFTVLSRQLEGAGTRNDFQPASKDRLHWPASTASPNYHELVDERDKLVEHIRGLDGFDRFLLPRAFSQLQAATQNGPVICINVSKSRCDALILRPGVGVDNVPLEKFSQTAAYALYQTLRRLLGKGGGKILLDIDNGPKTARDDTHPNDSSVETAFERILHIASTPQGEDRGYELVPPESDPEMEFQSILAQLWGTVVKPILDGLEFSGKQQEDDLTRMWWCTTGYLTFLPIHAAGIYGENAFPGSKLSDFVVSSYTPTLSSLITNSRPTSLPNHQVLAVALPTESSLPGSLRELDCIADRVGSSHFKKLVDSEATLENVVAGLEESSFVHFACHGVQHPTSPNESALLLAKSSRLTLSHLGRLSLPHAQLAFLSACQTATGDEMLVREAIHLAAGMLSVGYRGVIGTMWSIRDSDAPVVADEVYAQLFKDSEPDPTQAARALHRAIKKLIEDSDGRKSFLAWVPFIHIGI